MKTSGDTIIMTNTVGVLSYAAVGGKKEAEGPLAKNFDVLITDSRYDEKTWERAESSFSKQCLHTALHKAHIGADKLNAVVGGDLQNQCTATSYTMCDFSVPLLGVYSACATMTQALALCACMVDGGAWQCAAAVASSHFCTAERQFRTPLVYGGKRTPTAQWTVTGAGAVILTDRQSAPYVRSVTFGKVCNFNISDINNMGAAMAPAAASTIMQHFKDTGTSADDFDAIYTGDLGHLGSDLLLKLLLKEGVVVNNHRDCGLIIYDRDYQKVHCGASGAACSATVLCCDVLPKLASGQLKRVLFLSTGALMSQTTFLQGQNIPAIAHLAELCAHDAF